MQLMTKKLAVLEAIKKLGLRSSLVELRKLAQDIYHSNWMDYHLHWAIEFFFEGLDEEAIAYREKAKEKVVIDLGYCCVIRKEQQRRHSLLYDCRTHRDVPGRNMIEPMPA